MTSISVQYGKLLDAEKERAHGEINDKNRRLIAACVYSLVAPKLFYIDVDIPCASIYFAAKTTINKINNLFIITIDLCQTTKLSIYTCRLIKIEIY